ncbi:MAG: hypothetical protein ACYDC3_03740 [Candidatus Binataceae bacterium]
MPIRRKSILSPAALGSLVILIVLIASGCSSNTPSTAIPATRSGTVTFDLSRCEPLEPSLYRCPGIDSPLCTPDFDRIEVQCVKITKSGELLQELPADDR